MKHTCIDPENSKVVDRQIKKKNKKDYKSVNQSWKMNKK